MNFKFANINAKVKGMYAKTLKQNDYEELCKQKTVKEALIWLKQDLSELQSIADNARRREIEKQLENGLKNDINKIYRLLDKKSKHLLTIYIQKFKLQDLKEKIALLPKDESRQAEVERLLEIWQGTEYHKILQRNLIEEGIDKLSIFKLENELDKCYFSNLYVQVKKQNNNALLDLIR